MPPIIAAGKFQFHKGTIKTILCRPKRQGEQKFQFHKGTIKTELKKRGQPRYSLFQFHKGTIKTRHRIDLD